MSTPIRQLLSAAQQAETRGERGEAVRLLNEAASFYQERNMARRAQQMLRQARRLSGDEVEPPDLEPGVPENFDDDQLDGPVGEVDWSQGTFDDFGFGDELMGHGGLATRTEFERVVMLADATADAWCSFCCRPQRDVGPLAAGPAGAYVCGGCVSLANTVLGGGALPPKRVAPSSEAGAAEPSSTQSTITHLSHQARAHRRWTRGRPRLTLVVGPSGSGKSALLRSWGVPRSSDEVVLSGGLALVDVEAPLTAEVERRLLRWLDGDPARQAVVAVRGASPTPAVVLSGESGDEAVYTTEAIHQAVAPALTVDFAGRIDAVIGLPPLGTDDLTELARLLANARGLRVGDSTLAQFVALAERSGRGAHELAALLARLPAGRYDTP